MFGLALRLFSMKNFIYARVGGCFDIFLIIFLIDFTANNINKSTIRKIIVLLTFIIFCIFYLKTSNFENPRNKLEYKNILMENEL